MGNVDLAQTTENELIMLYILSSSMHQESLPVPQNLDEQWVSQHQVVVVQTGGSEQLFLRLLDEQKISLKESIYLYASGQSNSLAASMEILSYINQHNGHGEIRTYR